MYGDSYCFTIADGLGGHGNGEIAAQAAVDAICTMFVDFVEFLAGIDGKLKPTIYGVSAFDVNAAELVDVLKANNNGEICDDENGYSYSFSNISIGVYREALPDEIEEMIEEAKSDGSPMSDDDIQYEMKRANHWATIGCGNIGYYQR